MAILYGDIKPNHVIKSVYLTHPQKHVKTGTGLERIRGEHPFQTQRMVEV